MNSTEFQSRGSGPMDDHRPRRAPLKARRPVWKEELRQNCLKRVREERSRLLWKFRSNGQPTENQKGMVESTLRDIVSDELKKIKQSSFNDCLELPTVDTDDTLWEYDGPHEGFGSAESESEMLSEELLIEMDKVFHEEVKAGLIQREIEGLERVYEEEDDYLAEAVFEQMQLNDCQVEDKMWCPICKRGELRENLRLIYCTCCKLQLDIQSDKVNLGFLRVRLAEAHMEHLERGCRATPKFAMESKYALTALCMNCQACDTFEIIL